MTRRKSVCSKWTLVLVLVILCQFVHSRPQETVSSPLSVNETKSSENPIRDAESPKSEQPSTASEIPNISREVKTKTPVIGESIKKVTSQLLDKPSNASETFIVTDTRIPPKLKTQIAHKHKVKTRNEDGDEPIENSHVGVAVPVTMEELETENKLSEPNESSTSNEGISTWILLSNPTNKDNISASTEPTKVEGNYKKEKPVNKNKTKRPQNKVPAKRPIIGSTNKSDLVAGGSAINENVYNKIKDTVLTNVQKNKNASPRTTTPSTTTTTAIPSTTEILTTKKEVVTKAPATVTAASKSPVKLSKKKNKNKQKVSTTLAPIVSESAILPMEPKEQEIELEISTPATTTKKPKRSSTRKKTKTKKRKTSKPKPGSETTATEVKTTNKTKTSKPSKKPTAVTGPITTQLYNYFSREVMPSAVGVGVLGLAGLVGLASYFLYPFSTPVRRTFEVDKKDDIYRHNAEEYASEGNGQAEEEMLGTVLAGMPAHSKQKLNPYAAQTAHINRYPVKKEQDIRYRHVAATTSYEPNYNIHYPQQKTGIAHAAVYAEPLNYHHHQQYEMRHAYTTESKYDKSSSAYTPYPAVEPIYAAPQTGPSGISSFGSDSSSAVVYGVKPSVDTDFKPVYPYEGQIYSDTTSNPITYAPTSMYLGSNNDGEEIEGEKYSEDKYGEEEDGSTGDVDNKFVVGNVPKELSETATPAVVPEHGPRKFSRKRRNSRSKRSIVNSIDDILNAAKDNKDVFLSNEIDGMPSKMAMTNPSHITDAIKTEVVESVSTLPIGKPEKTTENEMFNEVDVPTTAKPFRVYEVFPSTGEKSSSLIDGKIETTTDSKNLNTETTTEYKSETTSTMPPSPSPISDISTLKPNPTYKPEVITYPPLNQDGGIFSFLKRLVEFKYRLGLSILQSTSESLNRYLRSLDSHTTKA